MNYDTVRLSFSRQFTRFRVKEVVTHICLTTIMLIQLSSEFILSDTCKSGFQKRPIETIIE
jgi:hypothetical protein